mmetsp:Transcript_23237/g.64514  ORF Transcript_23237/g.64514 Transcript_23237/m.64514 type:complete len:148 (+) Transcript_23237:70-513(+)
MGLSMAMATCMPHAAAHSPAARSRPAGACSFGRRPGRSSSRRCGKALAATVDPPDLKKVAQMAHIGISEQEIEEWTPQIASIVDWFGQLSEVDLSEVQPALRGIAGEGSVREDVPVEFEAREEMLALAPDMEGNYVRVPKITTGADS